ncbi:PREDICTED: uncharacterized protein LOC105453447 isoform X2 [Wasmannia auropunctata]|uniref:uncharacterized protein LOC105453447 isoform X2 n=1 Tax=Wasmannia auropunctata TaxID=64793 RepID=UPI0005F09E5D|nr:PREDICTED: uncharacterized protein LOC105453447 isoform X2 [Wasmannia auropunctata]
MGNATAAANVNGNPLVTIPLSQYLEVSLFGDLHNCTTCKGIYALIDYGEKWRTKFSSLYPGSWTKVDLAFGRAGVP